MNKELKEYKKYAEKWSVGSIIGQATSMGIGFMAKQMSGKELKEQQKILVNEINKRIK